MSEFSKREEEILKFWQENKIFEKSLTKHAPQGEYIFYDGPPFATGLPHTGSLLSSVIKDVVPRYKTMRGYRVPRRWGWDCHGLPIESLVEKELGLKTKKDILSIGIDTFNEKARSMVLAYVRDWERYVDRIGRWVDFKNSYKTMDNSYIESVWWALRELNKKKLLYEGRKVLMYCPHCETPLAKAEIAMDNTYKDITEEAVTVKFRVKNPKKFNLPEHTYLLAWTTTPWTLPGNVALAVGPTLYYGLSEEHGSYYLKAQEGGRILGKDLLGLEYEPLYSVSAIAGYKGKKYVVLPADFVKTDEGTGVVHTAVMYGEDDFALGQKEKLPMVQLLEPNGHYNHQAPEFIRGEYIKKAEKLIKEDLEKRELLYRREKHTHSYPHCYRCGTALIYNAVASWFINIQKVKQKMLSENEKIVWVPQHLKHGRFKNIVENAPDWTISRNRFWASPLPIWKEKGGNRLMVIGSVEELLAKTKRSGNRYFVMRHGEAQSNVARVLDSNGRGDNHLTEKGRGQVLHSAAELKKENIDLIITSPILRTRETAEIVQQDLGLPASALMVDERLRERGLGVYDGKTVDEWHKAYQKFADEFTQNLDNVENFTAVRRRLGEFLFEVERRYTNKNILIVTHGDPFWALRHVTKRTPADDLRNLREPESYPNPAAWEELPFVPFPHNAQYELDLHRPYVDHTVLVDSAGRRYERISEVIDCWVESGSMPFASAGYPKDTSRINPRRLFGFWPKGYPGDFIAEYIAQTRTWFYYMHAIGILLFNQYSFKTVVSTGTILAADGSKMSKSKGNYTDPYALMELYGADALRFHLMNSVVMQSEDLNFRDEDVRETHNRVLGILWNSYKFFDLYKESYRPTNKESSHVLDRWLSSRLSLGVQEVTKAFEEYDTPTACRALRALIEDYSTWYLRRSRDRAKDEANVQDTLGAQRKALRVIAQLCAPVMPFIAESIYRGVEEGESVHLSSWPEVGVIDTALLDDMQVVRELASRGLQMREQAGIKVRQPLAKFEIAIPLSGELQRVLAEELNVKTIVSNPELQEPRLDTTLSEELKEEGTVRNLIRRVQEWRKEQKLTINDRPVCVLPVRGDEREIAEKNKTVIMQETNLEALTFSDASR